MASVQGEDPGDLGRYAIEVGDVVRVERRRGSDGDETLLTAADGDVLEIVFDDGLVDVARVAAARGGLLVPRGDGQYAVRPDLAGPAGSGPDRGSLRRAVREVRRFRLPSVEDLIRDGIVGAGARLSAAALARGVVAWNEQQFAGDVAPGVYRADADLELHPLDGGIDPGDGPYLLLIHGTFSTTRAAFGALRRTAEWAELRRHYDGRILALEHRTLSVDPVHNALEVLAALPSEVRLHLLTHSRGGIVGDLLAAPGVSDRQVARFRRARGNGADDEVGRLRRLEALKRERRATVERFVRVAAPAGGTLLASRRLDLYLKVMLNVVGVTLPGNPVYGFVKALALHLADQRADVDAIPGVEAQMPESPYMALLATMPPVDDGLAVVAGDIEGAGILGRLKILATDLYYREDHDLVVNTRSMYRGVPRERAFASFQKGPDVAHSGYFAHEVTRARVRNWLARPPDTPATAVRGFVPLPADGWLAEPDNVTRSLAAADNTVVAFVPAQATTSLLDGDRVVWPGIDPLATEGMEALDLDLTVGQIVDAGYRLLLDRLGARHTVVPIGWDWRAPLDDTGQQFARRLAGLLDASTQPVSVVAHAGGGLLPLWLRARRPEVWARMRERAGRLVLLGTPLGPDPTVRRWFDGVGDLPRQLALLDPDRDPAAVGAVLAGLPGLAAVARGAGDLLTAEDATGKPWAGVAYVAATRDVPPANGGDGSPPHEAFPPDLPTWHAPVGVADLASAPAIADGVVELLATGRTAALHVGAPPAARARMATHVGAPPALGAARAGAGTAPPAAPADRTAVPPAKVGGHVAAPPEAAPVPFPTRGSLVAAALGDLPRGDATDPARQLRVEVLHGGLEHVGLPVMIGHYRGAPLDGATAFVDRQLGGRLSDRQVLGMFPEEQGTAIAVDAPECDPPGAIVLGLGPHGELTAERLVAAVTAGALRRATVEADRPMEPGETLPRPVPLAAVLVGSSGREGLSIDASVTALVKGVAIANTVLHSHGVADRVRIDELRLVELYADRAEVAARAVRDLDQRLGVEFGADLDLHPAPYLGEVEGGIAGQPPADYEAGRWHRLRVAGDRHVASGVTTLEFVRLGGRAGTDAHTHMVENANVDDLLAEAVRDPSPAADTRHTLYELLLPPVLKGEFQEADNLQLLLDPDAAAYPWELLAGRSVRGETIPLALRSGMLRQLEIADAPPRPGTPAGRRALVIGDPPATPRYPRLQAARHEAATVADVLEAHGYEVTRVIGGDGGDPAWSDVLNALFARDYRIVHIASHGQFVPDDPTASGVVIGPDRYLTARTVRQMPTVPELVFLNCCHLARLEDRASEGNLHRLAASVAEALIGIGVRAVVAAGWAVHDGAAAAFAQGFYDRLVRGHAYGEAVRGARWEAHDADAGATATWGAYQCYGDASFRLRTREVRGVAPPPPVAWPALIRRVDQLRREARHTPDVEPAAAELDRLEQTAPAVWRHAELHFAFGRAWAALGRYRRAIASYTRALEAWDADAPLKVLEQLGNMEVRLARSLADGADDDAEREQLLTRAQQRFARLRELAPTPERHALVASFHKKRACLRIGDGRAEDLRAAADAYAASAALAQRRYGRALPYQVCNELQLRYVGGDGAEDGWEQRLEVVRAALPRSGGGLWDRIAETDVALTAALAGGSLDTGTARSLADDYRRALRHGADRLQRLSVLEHLDDLATLAAGPAGEALRALHAGLAADPMGRPAG